MRSLLLTEVLDCFFFSCSWLVLAFRAKKTINAEFKGGKATGRFQVTWIIFSVQVRAKKTPTLFRLCHRCIPLKICYTTHWIPFILPGKNSISASLQLVSLKSYCKTKLPTSLQKPCYPQTPINFSIDPNIFAFFSVSFALLTWLTVKKNLKEWF